MFTIFQLQIFREASASTEQVVFCLLKACGNWGQNNGYEPGRRWGEEALGKGWPGGPSCKSKRQEAVGCARCIVCCKRVETTALHVSLNTHVSLRGGREFNWLLSCVHISKHLHTPSMHSRLCLMYQRYTVKYVQMHLKLEIKILTSECEKDVIFSSHAMCGFCLFSFAFCVYLCVLVSMYVSTYMCGGQEDIFNIICLRYHSPTFFWVGGRQVSHWTGMN